MWCQILLPQWEGAGAMGRTRGNIQSFFSTSLLGSISHLTSLHLPFPACLVCTVGRAFYFVPALVCYWSFPATAQLHCKSRHSLAGFQYAKDGAAQTWAALLCVLPPWRSPSPVCSRLDLFLFGPILFFPARTHSPLRL